MEELEGGGLIKIPEPVFREGITRSHKPKQGQQKPLIISLEPRNSSLFTLALQLEPLPFPYGSPKKAISHILISQVGAYAGPPTY